MSTRGRKAELQVIEGGLQTVPDVPAHIPPAVHAEWLSVVSDLKKRQVLTDAMLGAVESYVLAIHNMRQAQKSLDLHGALIDGGKGLLKVNPASSMLGKAQSTILRLSAELGLTPAARSRKNMKGDDDEGSSEQKDMFNDLMDF